MNDLEYCEHDGQEKWAENDGHGIFLCYVCELCYKVKLAKYRPEVLNSAYECDEPIEPEEY